MALICCDCGVKYLTDKQKEDSSCHTFSFGECIECKEVVLVTADRHYNYRKQLTETKKK